MKKIRVAAVSYLNTKPLLYGIKNHVVLNDIELIEAYPSRIAQMLMNDEIDLGLIPVAIIPQLSQSYIITEYCIGCDGAVASVGIFSDVPIEQVEKVVMDYQSKTSVQLAKILLKKYWKLNVDIVDANGEEYRHQIKGKTAGLVIGDRAFEQRQQSKYFYDLGQAWKDFTGLPFVFAAWISNKELPSEFVNAFNDANRYGVENIDKLLMDLQYDKFDLEHYFKDCISYELNEKKQEALELFLKMTN